MYVCQSYRGPRAAAERHAPRYVGHLVRVTFQVFCGCSGVLISTALEAVRAKKVQT